MIGGGGERKTLRLVAKYAHACNLFNTPDLAHKLDVLKKHCEREGRDYDSITKTAYHRFDTGENGEKTSELIDELGRLHGLGFERGHRHGPAGPTPRRTGTHRLHVIPVAKAF